MYFFKDVFKIYKKAKEYNSTKQNKFILVTRSTDTKGLLGLLRVTNKARIFSFTIFFQR